jgi:hypothetical protein
MTQGEGPEFKSQYHKKKRAQYVWNNHTCLNNTENKHIDDAPIEIRSLSPWKEFRISYVKGYYDC